MVHCVVGFGEVDKGSYSDYTFLTSIFNELHEVQEMTSAGLSWPETCLLRDEVLIHKSSAWCSSTHTRKPDVALNGTMRIITGCMRPTETTFLSLLAGITPPDIRREARVAKLTVTAKNNSDHLLHYNVTAADAACPQRLVSHRPFSRHVARLSNDYDTAKVWSDRVDRGPPLI